MLFRSGLGHRVEIDRRNIIYSSNDGLGIEVGCSGLFPDIGV
jgi:hypothetical protein